MFTNLLSKLPETVHFYFILILFIVSSQKIIIIKTNEDWPPEPEPWPDSFKNPLIRIYNIILKIISF